MFYKGYMILKEAYEQNKEELNSEAFLLFQEILAKNPSHQETLYYLGHMYENGLSVDASQKMALFYYERALNSSSEAAEKIYYKLGHFYESGLGMNKPNPQKGFSFFKQGADLGDFDCCARLG